MTLKTLWRLCLLLLFVLPDAESETVTGLKGDSITLPCNLKKKTQNLDPVLTFGSKVAYGVKQDSHFKGRVHRNGSCDFIIKSLKTTDAGRYTLKVHDKGFESRDDFSVHVKVNLTGWKYKELVFDDMPSGAESVQHFTNSGQEEVWRREKAVLTDRLTDNNGRLTIVNFTSSDEGTYRVLNPLGGILVTFTVTELSTGSKDTLKNTAEDEAHHTGRVHAWVWIIPVLVLVLVTAIVIAVIVKHQCWKRNNQQSSYQESVCTAGGV